MTNSLLSDRGAGLAHELMALAPIGGQRRPVKVVEHPSFAPRRRLRAEALHAAFTVMTLPVVTLDSLPRASDCRRTPSTHALRVA